MPRSLSSASAHSPQVPRHFLPRTMDPLPLGRPLFFCLGTLSTGPASLLAADDGPAALGPSPLLLRRERGEVPRSLAAREGA